MLYPIVLAGALLLLLGFAVRNALAGKAYLYSPGPAFTRAERPGVFWTVIVLQAAVIVFLSWLLWQALS